MRRLGGDAASLEQGIDEIREKIQGSSTGEVATRAGAYGKEKEKKVEARLMNEKRQRELKAKKRRREMLEQYELKHKRLEVQILMTTDFYIKIISPVLIFSSSSCIMIF